VIIESNNRVKIAKVSGSTVPPFHGKQFKKKADTSITSNIHHYIE
jgi:hypothetical protein